MSALKPLIDSQVRAQRGALALAALCAAATALAAVLLLGLSGWFLAGAAVAGAAGPAAAQAFNYLLPSAAIRFLAILRTAARYGERLFGHQAALRALAGLRRDLFAALVAGGSPLAAGEAAARLGQDVDAIETRFVRRPAPWSLMAGALAASALAALANPWAALAAPAGLGLQLALSALLAERLSRPAGGEVLAATGRLKTLAASAAGAAAELRCYGLVDATLDRMAALDAELGRARTRAWIGEGSLALAPAVATGLTVAAILALTARSGLALSTLAALAGAAAMEGAAGLGRAFERGGALAAASARLEDLLAPMAPAPPSAVLDLAPGEVVALTGPSGAGKTRRLLALMAGEPERFAWAPQEAPLLLGTVADNLRVAAPAAGSDEMWAALRDTALDERIAALPRGLETWVGDGGQALSGGERRRLSLARALLSSAPVLLLDEPTEGLDAATEARVVARLGERLARTGQGAVIVSHRTAPLVLARRVLDIDG